MSIGNNRGYRMVPRKRAATAQLWLTPFLAAAICALPLASFGDDWEPVPDATIDGRYQGGAFAGGQRMSRPTYADIDADGDQDLFIGVYDGYVTMFENVGSERNPQWAFPVQKYSDIDVGYRASPFFADIDADGDLDLFIGERHTLFYYENTGTATQAAFPAPHIGPPPFPPVVPVEDYAGVQGSFITCNPTLEDIDGDGDLDLFVGKDQVDNVTFYENTGTVSSAAWAAGTTNYANIDAYRMPAPIFHDIDSDGDSDLFVGSGDNHFVPPSSLSDGSVYFCENTGDATTAMWSAPTTNYQGINVGFGSAPTFADLDNDDDADLFLGASAGTLHRLENIGSISNAVWGELASDHVYVDYGDESAVALVDIDGDGDLDLFSGEDDGELIFYANIGSVSTPIWDAGVFPYGNIDSGFNSMPTFGDVDGDGDLDLLVGNTLGEFHFYENTGSVSQASWYEPPPFLDPFNALDVGFQSAPVFYDIDDDGDLDLFSGEQWGHVVFFENTGTPAVAEWSPAQTNYGDMAIGYNTKPTFADIDGDGDGDLLIGRDGELTEVDDNTDFYFYENTGTAATAAWAPAVTNFGGLEAPPRATPSLADLDSDGDLDLLTGEFWGGFRMYRNNETKLRVSPPLLTTEPGPSHTFQVLAHTGTVTWSFVENNSSGSIDSVSGAYTPGTNAPAIDVVQAVDTNGTFGRAHINVIDPADAAAVGKAVVIAGAKASDDPVWDATDLVANKAYLTLLRRGFAKTNIYYLSFDPNQDVDGDGLLDDIDGESSLANANYAFNTFANNADKLFVFLADHGSDSAGEGYMRLSPAEQLSATQLNSWVSDLQNSDTNMDVTIAMDFCYSGSFLDELVYTGTATRVNIASTDTNELTYFIAGGLVSFSDAFLTALQIGYDFNNAFLVARGAMSTYQLAQMDDNSDGVYDSGVDGANATNRLGATFVAGQDIPQIGTINPNQTITTGTTVTLFADDVSAVFPIERVWCLVVPPSHTPDTDGGVPVLDIPEVELSYNASLDRYETDFSGFSEQGVYKVVFIAKDIWDNVSIPKQSYINQGNFDERAIIVAGGPDSDPNWSNISFIAQATYNVLQARLFDHDTIYYISADTNIDIDADGTNDVDATPSLSSISNAISTWAASGDRLNVFLIGNGTNDELQVTGSQILDAGSFDSWLDAFQASDRDVNVVMEFDGSGGFATNLVPPSGKERINIASTRQGRRNVMEEGGLVSFSQYFLTEIFGGKTIGDATTKARKTVRRASGSLRQRAGIDDNGDGQLNEKNVDGLIARDRYIGAAFATGDDSPNIAETVPVTALTNTSSLTIWASDVTDVDGISNVWCVITPPDYDGESELPSEDLTYDGVDERYEVLYTNFTKAGGYTLTFYASDNEGEVSSAAQSAVVRVDEYEEDNTFQTAPMLNGDIFQIHTFHDSSDEDWIAFLAVDDFNYEIETFHFTTNIDTVIDLYYRQPDGTLTNIDHVDLFGFDEGELTGLDLPQDGIYYAQISQFITNGSLPGMYEVAIHVPAGNGIFYVGAIDGLSGSALPPGSYYLLDGQSNSFNGEMVVGLQLPGGSHTIEVVPADPSYLPAEDPMLPNQAGNPANEGFGNPKTKSLPQGDMGEQLGSFAFSFIPYVTVSAKVRDAATHQRLAAVPPAFYAQDGFFSPTNGYVFDGYPFNASYKSNWATDVEGDFPISMLVPATNSDLTLTCPGYSNYLMDSALSGVTPGQVIDLGVLELSATDTNGNGIADSWENLHFPGTNVNIGQDSDGDGHTDDEEYLLGTDPNSSTNVMAADEMMMTNGFTLVWPVENGRSYQIGCTTNLMSTNWTVVAGPWEATAMQTEMQWTDTNSISFTGRCYRVEMTRP